MNRTTGSENQPIDAIVIDSKKLVAFCRFKHIVDAVLLLKTSCKNGTIFPAIARFCVGIADAVRAVVLVLVLEVIMRGDEAAVGTCVATLCTCTDDGRIMNALTLLLLM